VGNVYGFGMRQSVCMVESGSIDADDLFAYSGCYSNVLHLLSGEEEIGAR
jgi:hypothetical protein